MVLPISINLRLLWKYLILILIKFYGTKFVVLDWYWLKPVDCVDNIVEVVKRSSTVGLNKAQHYDNGRGFST